jgi:hypothetical protein
MTPELWVGIESPWLRGEQSIIAARAMQIELIAPASEDSTYLPRLGLGAILRATST